MAKILLGLAIVCMLGSAVLGFLTKTKISDAATKAKQDEAQIAMAGGQVAKTQKELKDAQTQVASLTEKETATESAAKDAQAAADKANAEKADLQKKADDSDAQIKALNEKIASMATTSGTGTTATAPAVDMAKMDELTKKEQEDEQINKKLTEQNADMQRRMDKMVAAAQKNSMQANARQLEGQVLAVQPTWNFVIVSIGDRQGVAMNASLLVKRGSSMIAKLKVTSVEPTTSVADVVPSAASKGARHHAGRSRHIWRARESLNDDLASSAMLGMLSLLCAALMAGACADEQKSADGQERVSPLPWNRPQSWESGSAFPGINSNPGSPTSVSRALAPR